MGKYTPEQLYTQYQETASRMRQLLRRAKIDAGAEDIMQGQGRLLRLLNEKQGCAQKELSDSMGIRPASLSELLSKLQRKGLIRREGDQRDRRAHYIYLTDEGTELAHRLDQVKGHYAHDVFSLFDDEEAQSFMDMCGKVSEAALNKIAGLDHEKKDVLL